MKLSQIISKGISLVTQHRKLIGIVYLINVAIVFLFSVPMFIILNDHVSLRTIRDQLSVQFDYSWWTAFDFEATGLAETLRPSLSGGFGPLFDNLELLLSGEFSTFGWTLFSLALLYIFVAAFFNGGAIALFGDERKSFSMSRFFSNAAKYFHHMAALAATAILVFVLFYKLLVPLAFSIVDSLTQGTISQPSVWFAHLFTYLVLVFFIFVLTLILDYAKVIVILENKESSWLCLWLSLKFIFKNNLKIFGLNFLLIAISIALVLIGGALISLVQSTRILLLLLAISFQQLFILLKIAMRYVFYASETVFYQDVIRATAPVKKRMRRKG